MSDRELLELAAAAVGYEISAFVSDGAMVRASPSHRGFFTWRPLADDGDALRLAVKLNLHVQIDFEEEPPMVFIFGSWIGEAVEEGLGALDRYAATRRAIVRAAAEIGRAMP